jgi:hypothetical protein
MGYIAAFDIEAMLASPPSQLTRPRLSLLKLCTVAVYTEKTRTLESLRLNAKVQAILGAFPFYPLEASPLFQTPSAILTFLRSAMIEGSE